MSDFETSLNLKVDKAIQNFDPKTVPPKEEVLDGAVLSDRIERIASEISTTVSLLTPKISVNSAMKIGQDPSCFQSAKSLLLTQIDKLKQLVSQLEN